MQVPCLLYFMPAFSLLFLKGLNCVCFTVSSANLRSWRVCRPAVSFSGLPSCGKNKPCLELQLYVPVSYLMAHPPQFFTHQLL